MKKFTHIIFTLIVSLLGSTTSFAGNYTWTGTTNTDWATGTSWNPNGVPSTNDTVTIVTNTNLPVLAANTTIKKFTMTSGTLDCNGFTLAISANATFNGGTINNGTLTCSGTSTLTFAGTTFGVVVNATGNNLLFNGSVFNNSLTAVKKGSSNDNSIGNNIFNGVVTLTDSGSGSLVLSNTTSAPDTFNSTLTVSARSTGAVYLAHQGTGNAFNGDVTFSTGNVFSNTYGTVAYNGNITLNSASANISFGNSTGTWTLASGKNISIGTFSAGTLTIRNLTQSDNSVNMRLALTGTGKLVLGNNSISAKLYASSNQLTFSATRFLSADTLIYTGGNNATSAGGNYFGSTVYIANTFSGNNYHFAIGSASVDTFTTTTTIATTGNTSLDVANGLFLGAVTFKNSITGTLSDRFYVWDCTFKGALTLDGIHSAIKFKNGIGNSLMDSTATLSLVSGYAGQLTLSYIEQRGSNAVNLNMSTNTSTGNNTILTIGPNAIFNSNFYYLGQRLELNGGTFNGNASFTRFSQQPDVCDGANVFNGTTLIFDSVAATTANRVFKLANTAADDFNGNVTFKQYGTGTSASTMKMYPAYTANSTFAGNVTVESNTIPIEFGANGGKVIFDGSANQTLSKTGSYNPAIKKLQMNKETKKITLNLPLTISDSLIFTRGVIASDSSNLLLIPDNCIVTGASDSGFVTGPVKKTGNDAFTFPLGSIKYSPLTISTPSNVTDVYTAQYIRASHNKGTNADSTIENESTCEYWKLDRNTGTSNVTVNLGWNSLSCNVYGLDSMHVAVWDTTTSKWKDKGNGGTTGNLTTGTVVSSSAISTFGIMTLADKFCTTLKPVTTATDVTCPGNQNGTARVTASGATPPYTYNWSPRTGGSVSLWDLNAGTFHISVTDSRGCSITDSAIVNDPDSIHLSITTTASDCHESIGTAKIVATGGSGESYFYFWTPGGEILDSLGGLAAGIYEVVVMDENGCSVDTTVSISDSDGPDAEVDSMIYVGCNGYNTGFARILSSDPSETDPTWPCWGPDPTRLTAGSYPVIVSDSAGCKTAIVVTITEPDPLKLIVTITESQCGDSIGSAFVVVTGGSGSYSYSWSSGGTDSIETNLASGFDTVTVTDANGCISIAVAIITDSDGPVLSPSSTNPACFDSSTGEISVIASGGTAPYQYYWYEIGKQDSLVDSLSEGIYEVLVTDSFGCKSKSQATITLPPKLLLEISSWLSATEDSSFDGSATVLAQGGTLPYYYLWLPDSQITPVASDLRLGELGVKVTDGNGCSNSIQLKSTRGYNIACPGTAPLYTYARDEVSYPSPCLDPYGDGRTVIDVTDFGAVPGDGNSDECAFEAVNNYIQAIYRHHANYSTMVPWEVFTVNFPFGAVGDGTYNVGRQTLFGETTIISNNGLSVVQDDWFAKGHSIFYLEDVNGQNPISQVNPILFVGGLGPNGEQPRIKFDDCMFYGAFINNGSIYDGYRLMTGNRAAYNCEIASVGSCFDFYNCSYITIKNLELDGNLPNLLIGGGTVPGAGINENHSGIALGGNEYSVGCQNITVDNVNVHDFGYCGIMIPAGNYKSPVNLLLRNSKFNKNGCCGFAWESGSGVRAYNCQFNRNALDIITTQESSGMDIETQGAGWTFHPSNGFFYECEFKYNQRSGAQCENIGGQRDFIFTSCTFVGSESHPGLGAQKEGNPICMKGARTQFHCCNFYGQITATHDETQTEADKAYFNRCTFNEDYYDADDNTTYSFSADCNYGCGNVFAEHKTFIAYFGYQGFTQYRRATFEGCTFNSNYGSGICSLMGVWPGGPLINAVQVRNCHFYNGGLDGLPPSFYCYDFSSLLAACSRYLMNFTGVNFTGRNSLEYSRAGDCDFSVSGVCNNPSFLNYKWRVQGCWKNGIYGIETDPSHNNLYEYLHEYYFALNGNCAPPAPLPGAPPFLATDVTIKTNYDGCQNRYINYATLQLFSSGVGDMAEPAYSYVCGSSPRLVKPQIKDQNNDGISAFPIPATNEVSIQNVSVGDEVTLFDILGNLLLKQTALSKRLSFDISELPNGIYFVRLQNNKSAKIIKAD